MIRLYLNVSLIGLIAAHRNGYDVTRFDRIRRCPVVIERTHSDLSLAHRNGYEALIVQSGDVSGNVRRT